MSTLLIQPSACRSWSAAFRLTSQPVSASAPVWTGLRSVPLRAVPAGSKPEEGHQFKFGPFCLLVGCRTLLLEGRSVECGGRAFDLLHILLLRRGTIVSKEDIIRHVWPTTCVEESNLRFQMACLRKLLGRHRDLIKTIPGRGYLLVEDRPDLDD